MGLVPLLANTAQANTTSKSGNTNVNAIMSEQKISSLTLDALDQQNNTERSGGSHYGSVKRYIGTVMAGGGRNYGMRFWLNLAEDNTA